MKPTVRSTLILMLGMVLILGAFAPPTQGQTAGRRAIFDSGVIRLGPGQMLRLTINGLAGNDKLNVRFRRMYYVGSANGGVWKGSVAAQDMPAPIMLMADEAVSIDASQGGFDAVRIEAIVRGYTGTTHVNAGVLQIMNSDGTVASFFDVFPELPW